MVTPRLRPPAVCLHAQGGRRTEVKASSMCVKEMSLWPISTLRARSKPPGEFQLAATSESEHCLATRRPEGVRAWPVAAHLARTSPKR